LFFGIVESCFNLDNNGLSIENNSFKEFVILSIFIPTFETICFITIPTFLLKFVIKKKIIIVLIISSLFAFFHDYSLIYIIYAFFAGIIMSVFYILLFEKYNFFVAFLLSILLHSAHNSILYLI